MMDFRNRTCCFTGHREIPSFEVEEIKRKLKDTLEKLINEGYCYFGAGGALGFDTLAAQAVLELREKYRQIKLILVLPCVTQADRWSESDRKMYDYIFSQADKRVYTSQDYTRDCMHKRNRHLVYNSSVCVCYLRKETGGTAFTVHCARRSGLKVINVAV
jgi:uncharacterized phage-like protein YoqJ